VSAVIARLPFTIALMRLSGTSMVSASRYWLIPNGRRNSSSSTSPGGTSIKSVVVNDFDLLWPGFRPDKAEPELVVDADAVLAMAVSPKGLQAIARWDLQIVETACGIEDGELSEGHASEASKAPHRLPLKQGPGVAAAKRPDHASSLPPLGVGMQNGGITPPTAPAETAAARHPARRQTSD
jgi:hypothetical protein